MDLEDKDYAPTESQSDMECTESVQDLIMEAKEPWDRVWAYCADCGERGKATGMNQTMEMVIHQRPEKHRKFLK